jgi:hypothetical protein
LLQRVKPLKRAYITNILQDVDIVKAFLIFKAKQIVITI